MNVADRVQACAHCGNCTRTCAFLAGHSLDLAGFSRRPDLAFHCFLCGNCLAACPKNIDGRQVSLMLRSTLVASSAGRDALRPYKWILAEKRNYVFRNYRKATSGAVFFPGCNVAGYIPRTTRRMADFFRQRGIGTVFDCCAKPVWELAGPDRAKRPLEKLKARLENAGVEEIITACPNCYHFLKEHIPIRVRDAFSALRALGHRAPALQEGPVYLPCPDRREQVFFRAAQELLTADLTVSQGAQCCGLGGGALARDPELVRKLRASIRNQRSGGLYVYCASCAAALNSAECGGVSHLLTEAFGIDEKPRPGFFGLLHRCLFRFS